MSSMKAIQVSRAGGDFELVKRDIPEPREGEVRVRVEACGVCHSDAVVKEGLFPGISYPRIPGHEVAGYIDRVGEGVLAWKEGQRVGVGWHGGHCFQCTPCRQGEFINCEHPKVTGISYDGGYAEYMVAPQEGLALIPDTLKPVEAAPMLCAGITTFNALRNSGARAGDTVAVQGIGGLGHFAIQYASKFGFRTIAISRGREKETLALKLGAQRYIDSDAVNAAEELTKIGGARVALATAPNSQIISRLIDGLSVNGTLLVVAVSAEPIEVYPLQLISKRRSVQGWPSGTAKDSEDTMNFGVLRGVMPMVEVFPFERASEAYNRMITNRVRFRAVLKVSE